MLDQVIVPRMRTPVRRLAYVLRTYQAKRNLQIMRLLVEQKASFPSMMAMLSKTRKGSSLKILQVTYIMKDKDLLFDAKKLQNQASRVIKELLLKERWGKIGKVNFSGSFTFGLMINPNIDMEIYSDNPNPEIGFKIISEIAQTVGVKRIKYINQMDDETDPGLYYCIQYIDKSNLMWSIDSWLISTNHPFAHHPEKFTNAMNKRLNDEMRIKILRIKNDIYEHAETKIRSIDIYKAIIRDGIENYGEFFEWFKKNPPRKLENWLP